MAQHSHVPKLGNQENEEDVSDTVYTDKGEKGQSGSKIANPNGPKENSDPVSSADLPHSKPRVHSEDSSGKVSVRSHELQKSKEDGDPKHFTDSPARHGGSDSAHRVQGVGSADNRRRPSKPSTGSENIDRSPLHRLAKTPGRDSPSWEGKISHDSSHGTPGRSRLRPSNRGGDETPDKGAAVPKFGEWDESNPASADGYTHIFNKVREERQVGAGHVPGTPNGRLYAARNQPADDKVQSCCFCWGKK